MRLHQHWCQVIRFMGTRLFNNCWLVLAFLVSAHATNQRSCFRHYICQIDMEYYTAMLKRTMLTGARYSLDLKPSKLLTIASVMTDEFLPVNSRAQHNKYLIHNRTANIRNQNVKRKSLVLLDANVAQLIRVHIEK